MKKIIALRGRRNSGKTRTIRLLPRILTANGFHLIDGSFPTKGDFTVIFQKGVIKLGVTSSGDTYDLVKNALEYFVKAGCKICICACRTSDRSKQGTKRGTNFAVNSFPAYQVQFEPKTIASSEPQEQVVNKADAQRLFSLI